MALSTVRPRRSAVVTDVDGTLFSFAGRDLSPGNRQALDECTELGVHVCLATGRIPGPWFAALKAQLPALGPCVFGNGAILLDAQGDLLFQAQLPPEIISTVLEFTRGGTDGEGNKLCVLAATQWDESDPYGGVRYCELSPKGEPSAITALIERAGEPDAVLLPSLDGFEERSVIKFVIWTLPGEEGWANMPKTVAALQQRLEGTGATVLHHGERWCEILPPGVNKGSGVQRLLDRLEVPPSDTLACGDAENDVEMLRLVGVGAAMANAQPAALAAADIVVRSNADDGVEDAVRRFVLPLPAVDVEAAATSAAVGEDGTAAAREPAAKGASGSEARRGAPRDAPFDFYTLDMCPYAQRVWIALEELGASYTTRTVNLRGDGEERAWYEEHVNPRGKVPALRDASEGLTIFESLLINEYLAEACEGGSALLPADPAERARIRLWNERLDSVLAPAHFTLLMNRDEATDATKRAALDAALAYYEGRIVGPYLCGGAFTLADCAALPFFERLVFSLEHYKQLDALAAYPRTRAWLELAMARPSFVRTRRPVEKLVALYDRFLAADYAFGGLNKN